MIDIFNAWSDRNSYPGGGASQWAFQNGLQHRALSMARNISEQLRE